MVFALGFVLDLDLRGDRTRPGLGRAVETATVAAAPIPGTAARGPARTTAFSFSF